MAGVREEQLVFDSDDEANTHAGNKKADGAEGEIKYESTN